MRLRLHSNLPEVVGGGMQQVKEVEEVVLVVVLEVCHRSIRVIIIVISFLLRILRLLTVIILLLIRILTSISSSCLDLVVAGVQRGLVPWQEEGVVEEVQIHPLRVS